MSTTERETVTQMPAVLDPRVERGAALLDEKMPGWERRMNVATLDTGSTDCCVLGQAFGSFGAGAGALWEDSRGPDRQEKFHAHGFYTFDGDDDYESVQQDWRLAILSRRTS